MKRTESSGLRPNDLTGTSSACKSCGERKYRGVNRGVLRGPRTQLSVVHHAMPLYSRIMQLARQHYQNKQDQASSVRGATRSLGEEHRRRNASCTDDLLVMRWQREAKSSESQPGK